MVGGDVGPWTGVRRCWMEIGLTEIVLVEVGWTEVGQVWIGLTEVGWKGMLVPGRGRLQP